MFRKLFFTKFIVLIIVAITMVNSIVFVGAGVFRTYKGTKGILLGMDTPGQIPLLEVFTSLEYFLIALVFIVFALGISQLFLTKKKDKDIIEEVMPKWLKITNFNELKFILWETILTTLLVLYMVDIIESNIKLSWEATIIPVVILIFSISLFILKRGSFKELQTDLN